LHANTFIGPGGARLTGLGKTTIARSIKAGRLSASRKDDGSYEIDPAELARVYPFTVPNETVAATGDVVRHATPSGTGTETDATADATVRYRLAQADEKLAELKGALEDMRRDRDAWREQAQKLTLPKPTAPPMTWWRWPRTTG